MAIQLSTTLRNNRAAQIETTVGASGLLEIFTGAQPANCAAADTGTKLASITLPADWMNAPSSGSVSAAGLPWTDNSADGTGVAAHYRLKASGGTCHIQGSVSITGGGGDLQVDSVNFTAGQVFNVTAFSYTEPNA